MATKKTTGAVTTLTEGQIAALDEAYPVMESDGRSQLPRLGMIAKDVTEETGTGKAKKIEIVQAAGTFYTERDMGEVDEDGKKVWTREYIDGETINGIIAFHRRQLRLFDSSLNKFISTPIFDNATQVIPLYLDRQVIAKGTQAELQARYPALSQKGKPTSKLKEETILFVVYEGELYQMNLSQSSKWTFKDYQKTGNPSLVVTTFGSVEDEFGSNKFHKTVFTKGKMITPADFELVNGAQKELRELVEQDGKLFLGSGEAVPDSQDVKF